MYKIIGGDQKEYGPVSADVLRQWLSEGRVGRQTMVLPEGAGAWKPLSELPEFAAALMTAPPAPAPAKPGTNTMAVVAFVLSLCSLLCCGVLLGPVSLILAFIARSQIKKNPGQEGGGFTIAAIIISIIAFILSIVGIVLIFSGAFNDMLPPEFNINQM